MLMTLFVSIIRYIIGSSERLGVQHQWSFWSKVALEAYMEAMIASVDPANIEPLAAVIRQTMFDIR